MPSQPPNLNYAMNTTRRQFLASGIGATAVATLGAMPNACGQGPPPTQDAPAAAPATTFKPGKAKSVIQIWQWGGPTHIDTFDPKPEAGADYCGPLGKPIDTAAPGIKVGQLLPKLAAQAEKFSIIRSLTHGNNNHETAAYIMQTGRLPGGGIVYPNTGAVTSLFKGVDAGYDNPIPPYVVLTTGQGRFSESGFLGTKHKPFVTGGDPSQNPFIVSGFVARGVTPERQEIRKSFVAQLDALGQADANNALYQQIDAAVDTAYTLVTGSAVKTFDLTTENEEVRKKYGRNHFGQSCLVARRLVEAGVPYITINSPGWDTHKGHFSAMNRLLPVLDAGLASLIEDLATRGLLDTTVVWMCGEFGRTTKVDMNAPWFGGRHHFGDCFSALVAGGGFVGGKVVGASDEYGNKPVDRPVAPQDLLGSILELSGINPDAPLPNTVGYDVPVMLAPSVAGRLREIMS